MKRINISAVLLVVLSLVFTGCSKNDKNNENIYTDAGMDTDVKDRGENTGEGKLAKGFVDILDSDEYMMQHKSVSEFDGQTHEIEIMTAKLGDKTYTTSKSELSDREMTFIIKDQKTYMINHEMKTLMVLPQEGTMSGLDGMGEFFEEQELETEGMVFVKSGKGEFKGKTYNYEEYSVDKGSIKYYFDKKDLIGLEITIEEGKSTWEIIELSDKVDEKLFEIPSGYELIDMGIQ